jgi:phthalate 4,5-dioxygenase oxygenase subunit
MLTKEENELLTRTGPGTPGGKFMRRYWLPALLSSDVATAGGQPMRVRLLGEDLVAFRNSDGTVGLLGAHCPHRGVALYFGRNEDGGLRCPYHGWKFDTAGTCLDMPNERPDRGYREKIRHTAYPCAERGGLIWTYMGEGVPPALPAFEWLDVPAEQRYLSLRVQECNWLQSLEGELDSSHAPILHARIDGAGRGPDNYVGMQDRCPLFKVADTPAGVQIGACRDAGELDYWRVNHFLLPFWTVVPPAGAEADINGHAWVPIDDETTLCVMYSYNPTRAMSEKRRKLFQTGARGREPGHMTLNGALPPDPSRPYSAYWPKWNERNDYGLDMELQRTKYIFGVPGLWIQDAACQESMGVVADRTTEHLGASDVGITQMRRLLRSVVTQLRDQNLDHPSMSNAAAYAVRSAGIMLPKGASWPDALAPYIRTEGPLVYWNSESNVSPAVPA